MVEAGATLVTIVPAGEELIVEALVLNRDRGFVRVGDRCVIKLEAFPFTRHGFLEGVVERVSADAINDERRGLVFPVRVRITGSRLRDIPVSVLPSAVREPSLASRGDATMRNQASSEQARGGAHAARASANVPGAEAAQAATSTAENAPANSAAPANGVAIANPAAANPNSSAHGAVRASGLAAPMADTPTRPSAATRTAPRTAAYPISPGMSAQVEIITGRRTVMDYLLSPIARATQEAGRER